MKCLPEVYGKSAVETPDGKSRKKKKNNILILPKNAVHVRRTVKNISNASCHVWLSSNSHR